MHVHLEIGALGLDEGNIKMTVDIAVMHLDSSGPRIGEFLPFFMTDTKIHWLFGRFQIRLSTTTAHTVTSLLYSVPFNVLTLFHYTARYQCMRSHHQSTQHMKILLNP